MLLVAFLRVRREAAGAKVVGAGHNNVVAAITPILYS